MSASSPLFSPDLAEFEHAVKWAKEWRKLNAAAYSARVRGFRRGAGRMYVLRANAEVEVQAVAHRAIKEAGSVWADMEVGNV